MSTIADIHNLALQLLNSDTSDYDATKLLAYTNDGILFTQNTRIGANDPETMKTLAVTTPVSKPSDYLGLVGIFPVDTTGTTITRLTGAPASVTIKYKIKLTRVTATSDTFPLPDEYMGFVASYISLRLQDDNSMDVTQGLTILKQDIEAFIKAKGG